MSGGFEAAALERRYAILSECPANLLPTVVTLPLGTLDERVLGVRRWLDALLAGQLPAANTWPGAPVDASARAALEALGLVRFCKGQPELAESLLLDILESFRRTDQEFRNGVLARLKELEELERTRVATEAAQSRWRKRIEAADVELDEETLRKLRALAERETYDRVIRADEAITKVWGARARAWAEIADVFDDLGQMLGRGWDLSVAVLKHVGWNQLIELNKLVASLPQVRDIIRALGRLHATNDGESVADTILVPVRRLEQERLEVVTPLVPAETRGIERSGEIARMLPAEAALLGHPKLRLLWHARRAERALLTYRVEGIEVEQTWVERDTHEERESPVPRPDRGPIIAVIDTSGSMHGLPEQVAKAIVLEAVRTAHAEKRRCFVYSFSGPGQVEALELDLSPEGVGRLLVFLCMSFGGGTDAHEPLTRVVTQLRTNHWKKADVVIATDGEWPVQPALSRMVQEARDAGTRFHGIQIGNHGRTALHEVCDPVHVFKDWARAGGWT